MRVLVFPASEGHTERAGDWHSICTFDPRSGKFGPSGPFA